MIKITGRRLNSSLRPTIKEATHPLVVRVAVNSTFLVEISNFQIKETNFEKNDINWLLLLTKDVAALIFKY